MQGDGDLVLLSLDVEQQREALVLLQKRWLRLGRVVLQLHLWEEVFPCTPQQASMMCAPAKRRKPPMQPEP